MSNRIATTNNKDNKLAFKQICYAFGCSKKATEKVEIGGEKFGTILLHLCPECLRKFQ